MKSIILRYLSLTLLLSAAGCATASLEQRERVQNLAALSTRKQTLKESDLSRKPIGKGQWVSFLIDQSGQDLTLRTIRILDVSGTTVKMEVDSQSAKNGGALETEAYVIENFPLNAPILQTKRQFQNAVAGMKFHRVITRRAEKNQEDWADEFLMFNKSLLEKFIVLGFPREQANPEPAPCTNGTLDSPRCFTLAYKLEFLDHASEGEAQLHSEVPILGFVHAADESRDYKVIAFGQDGAAPRLTY